MISTAISTALPRQGALSLSERHVMLVMLVLLLSCNMLVIVVVRQPQICL